MADEESRLARRRDGGARAREHLASGARPGKASGRDQADSASPQRLSCKVDGARCLLSQARIPPPAKTCERLQVGVIGAGMAGLYAAMLIKSLGIDFEELEAAEAPGGRVRTHHFSEEEWDYVDLGAMRVPKIPIMDRVVGNVPWSLTNKLPGIKLGDYYESDGRGITMYNGFRVVGEIDWKADPFHFPTSKGGNVPDKFVHEGPDHWLTKVIQVTAEVTSTHSARISKAASES